MKPRYRVFLAMATLALATSPAIAQEFTLQSATTYKMGGVLGFAAKLGGMPKETIETTYLSGHKLRTDNEQTGTIIDADAGVFTMINKKDKSYTTMSFDDMAAMMRQMQAKSAQQRAQKTEQKDSGDVAMKYSAKVDVTGKQETIAGYNAKQVLMTLSMDMSARPEGEQDMQQAGSMVIFVDMWNTEDAPHARAMKAFHEAYARKAASEFGSAARGMEGLYASYPAMKEAMEAASKEMKKVPGVSVRTVTHVVLVPPDKKFDRELAVAAANADAEKKEEKGGLGKALGGMLAPKKKSDADEQANMTQSTIMRVTNEVREAKAGGVPADAFTVPAGFKEKKFKQ